MRRTALWQAAELLRAAGDRASASRIYAAYVQRYPAPFGAALEARQTLADLARDANDADGRNAGSKKSSSPIAAAGAGAHGP